MGRCRGLNRKGRLGDLVCEGAPTVLLSCHWSCPLELGMHMGDVWVGDELEQRASALGCGRVRH